MTEEIDPKLQFYATNNQNQDLIKFQLDSSMELEELKADLLGKDWDDERQGYFFSPHKEKMVNEKGANAIMSFLKPRVTKIISLSNADQEDINKRGKNYIDGLSIMLTRHRIEYGISSFAILDNIIDTCDDVFRATALKSIGGWEGDGIRKQHTTVESRETIHDMRKPPQSPFSLPFKPGGAQ